MQIKPINTVNFGYDPKLNAKLVNKLTTSKKNREYCDSLLILNDFVNNMEKKVRDAEAQGKQRLLDKLTGVFADSKAALGAALALSFPKLHYCEKEIATYEEEAEQKGIKTDDQHWLREVIDQLEMSNIKIIDVTNLPEEIRTRIQNVSSDEAKSDSATVEKGKSLVKEYVPTEISKHGFASLGGMTELKEKLNDRIVGMLKDPEQAELDFIEYGKKTPKGFLMYGPPGCGKTTIVEHLASEANVPLLKVEVGSIGSPYIHEMSMNIDAIFDYAESRATKEKPVLLFIDDADALFSSRSSGGSQDYHYEELNTFLNRVQKAGDKNVIVIAATNRKDIMDEAIVSRFEEQVEVPLPDFEARKAVVKLFMNSRKKGVSLANDEAGLNEIAKRTDNFSIRALKNMSELTAMKALKDGRRDITKEDFLSVVNENQKLKTNPELYRTKGDRKMIGFNK